MAETKKRVDTYEARQNCDRCGNNMSFRYEQGGTHVNRFSHACDGCDLYKAFDRIYPCVGYEDYTGVVSVNGKKGAVLLTDMDIISTAPLSSPVFTDRKAVLEAEPKVTSFTSPMKPVTLRMQDIIPITQEGNPWISVWDAMPDNFVNVEAAVMGRHNPEVVHIFNDQWFTVDGTTTAHPYPYSVRAWRKWNCGY